jgi:L-amino acid N-acyltransferase YncA
MAITIRDIDLERDPEQIVDLYRRAGYGAAVGNGVPFTADDFRRAVRLNDMRAMLVADDDGRIVGIQGALAIDACRAAPPGHAWGNHLVIDAMARGGVIMGQLFAGIFSRMTEQGIDSVHARVNPKNRMAMRLDVRAGFRTIGSDRPDEDSFVELISHLPGVTAAARLVAVDPDTGEVWLPNLTLSSLREGRGEDMAGGVSRTHDGRVELTYHYEAKGLAGEVVVDGESGRILSLWANGVDRTDLFLAAQPPRWEIDADALEARFTHLTPRPVGAFTASIDPYGRLRLDHPDHLGPVFLDCFPDGLGHTVAYRRPPVLDLAAAADKDSWTLRDQGGTERRVTFRPDAIEVECRVPETAVAEALAVHPWVGLRTAEYAVTNPTDRSWTGPLRPGRWPPQLPAYEPAGDADWSVSAAGTQSTWIDRTAGLSLAIDWLDPGRLRCEGECRADGPVLRYRVRPSVHPPIVVQGSALLEPRRHPVRAWTETSWGRHSHRRLTGEKRGNDLTVSPTVGLIDWKVNGRTVLKLGSGERGFGALATVPSALWASLVADRSDVDRGPEWAGPDDRLRWWEPGDAVDSSMALWMIGASDDLSSLILTTDVPSTYAGLDATLTLKPGPDATRLLMADSTGQLAQVTCRDEGIERPWGLWWGFTRRVVIPIGPDRALDISALTADHGEILVRSVTAGFLVSMMSRVGAAERSVAQWGVRLTTAPNLSQIPLASPSDSSAKPSIHNA